MSRLMKGTLVVTCAALMMCVALASQKVPGLDGTSWRVEVRPDDMARDKGEHEFNETLVFVDGKLSLKGGDQLGLTASEYNASKSGKDDWSFKSEMKSASQGLMVWTGTMHEKDMEGKLVWTKP